ncbi:MAG: MFS transporter [Spirochaetaceae bacterium]|nr:MAG: MFS transporter [Spirochaetaceae bacterium]
MITVSPSRRRAMRNYYRFSIFNVISYTFLAGNIIILYSLRLGATSALVGLIAASYQVTFVFSLVGRRIIERVGAVRLFGYAWLVRYLMMVPVLLTALPGIRDRTALSLSIITMGVFGFNVAKGVGITGTKPIVGEIPPSRERGAFLSNHHLVIQLGAIVTGIIMALVLGQESPLGRYMLLLAVGIVAGLFASYFILRLPEPRDAVASFAAGAGPGYRSAFAPGPFRTLASANAIAVFAVSMVQAFLVVYLKRVYGYADGTIVFFTVAGAAGGATMALVSRAVMDRVGSKPLVFGFMLMIVAVTVPLAIAPSVSGVWVLLFPSFIYFFFVMGQMGVMNAADNYFFAVTEADQRLDLGIVFGLGSGIAGTLGSFLGGLFLQTLEHAIPHSVTLPFSIHFSVAGVLIVLAMVRVTALPDQNSYPISDALGMLISPRDIRTIRLLNRLRRSRTVGQEHAAVAALRGSRSRLHVEELAARISSPSLTIRMEAIGALRAAPLTPYVEELLIHEVETHLFTTAHAAAELLGEARVERAVPALRSALDTNDYMVCARAMVALAKIGDRDSIARIESLLDRSPNPRVTIYAVKALEIFGSIDSLPLIFGRIDRRSEHFVRDELILSCSAIVGVFDDFYPLYTTFLDDRDEGYQTLTDLSHPVGGPVEVPDGLVDAHTDPRDFVRIAAGFYDRIRIHVTGIDVAPFIADAVRNRNVGRLERFRFFVAAIAILTVRLGMADAR